MSGVTSIARAMAGTAVLRIVVSSDCMKKATATSQGRSRWTESSGGAVVVAIVGTLPMRARARQLLLAHCLLLLRLAAA